MRILILIDIQNDFLPGGALAVADGDQVIPIVNRVQPYFDLVVATQDWHPADHGSFAANHKGKKPGDLIELNGLPQVLWPVHCVQGSEGADFSKKLNMELVSSIFPKGTDAEIDSYSGFFDNGKLKATGLGDYLKEKEANQIYVLGLATDYCVKYTALDAVGLGFETFVITDGCRGVELNPGDVDLAWKEMREAGVGLVRSSDLFL